MKRFILTVSAGAVLLVGGTALATQSHDGPSCQIVKESAKIQQPYCSPTPFPSVTPIVTPTVSATPTVTPVVTPVPTPTVTPNAAPVVPVQAKTLPTVGGSARLHP